MNRFSSNLTFTSAGSLARRIGSLAQVVGLVLVLGLVFAGSAFAEVPSAKDRVDLVYGHIKKAAETAETQDALVDLVTSELDSFIDYEAFSTRTLRTSWPTLSAEQKAIFIDRFKRLIIKTYAKKFQPKTVFEVEHRGETFNAAKTEVTLKTTVRGKKIAADVDYQMSLDPKKGPRAIDIVIDEVSMALNWRKQFERIIAKDGFDALIGKINKRVEAGGDK